MRLESDLDAFKEQLSVPVGFGGGGAVATERAEYERLLADVRRERQRAERAEADCARMSAEFEGTLDEFRRDHVAALREQAEASASLPLNELLSAFTALERSTTYAELVTQLAHGLEREFRRVGRVEIRGEQVQGIEAVPPAERSLVSRAAASRQIETSASAIAVPILIGGATTIVYADDPEAPEFASGVPQARIKFADLLHRHALLVLLRIAVQEKKTPARVLSIRR